MENAPVFIDQGEDITRALREHLLVFDKPAWIVQYHWVFPSNWDTEGEDAVGKRSSKASLEDIQGALWCAPNEPAPTRRIWTVTRHAVPFLSTETKAEVRIQAGSKVAKGKLT